MNYRIGAFGALVTGLLAAGCSPDEQISGVRRELPKLRISNLVVVPNPAGSDNFTRGIYYFTGWRDPDPNYGDLNDGGCGHLDGTATLTPSDVPWQNPWSPIQSFSSPPRKPALGYYDDGQQSVSDNQILAMVDAGYDYVIYQMGWSHLRWNGTGTSGLTRGHAISNHMASGHASRLKVSVLWHDANSDWSEAANAPTQTATNYWTHLANCGWTATTYQNDLTALFSLWFGNYAQNGNFHKYNGRPVVFFFGPQNLKTPFTVLGGSTRPADAISLLRTVAATYGFTGATRPYVVGTAVTDQYVDSLPAWGFDASTGYVYSPAAGSTFTQALATYRNKWKEVLNKTANHPGFQYWVPNGSGADGRPWQTPNYWSTSNGSEFETLVKASMDTAGSSARASITGRNIVSCCWNEWGEGATIEPSTLDVGYSYRGSALADANRRTVLGQTAGSNRMPDGNFDTVGSNGFSYGWAVDPDTPDQPLWVHIYINGPYPTGTHIGSAFTTVLRGDINSAYSVAGTHGWEFTIPSQYCGKSIYIHLIDTSGNDNNPVGNGSGKIYNC